MAAVTAVGAHQPNRHKTKSGFCGARLLLLSVETRTNAGHFQLTRRAVVEVLLAAGVDVNTRTSAGTAMHEAALCGKMEVVRALLDRGVDLGIRDSRQNTVLDLLGQFPPHVTQDITAVIK
ncbi:unnamed protein product, partial [Heterotrigona itama]